MIFGAKNRRRKHHCPDHELKIAKQKLEDLSRLLLWDRGDHLIAKKVQLARRHYEYLLRRAGKRAQLDKDTVKFRALSLVYDYWFSERVNRVKAQWRAAAVWACERIIRNRVYMMKQEKFLAPYSLAINRHDLWQVQCLHRVNIFFKEMWCVRLTPDAPHQNSAAASVFRAAKDDLKIHGWRLNEDVFPLHANWVVDYDEEFDYTGEALPFSEWTVYRPCPRCNRACLRLEHGRVLDDDTNEIQCLYQRAVCGSRECDFEFIPTISDLVYLMNGWRFQTEFYDRNR